MKRYFSLLIVVVLSLSLTACFDGGTGGESVGISTQQFKSFSISVPADWMKISPDDFANTIPEETVAIYLKKVEGDDFIQNANVVKESINTDASSLEYAKANLLLGSKTLVDYRVVSSEEIEIAQTKTVLHSFRARNSTTEPLRHYSQTYFAKDKVAYTVTCISKDDDESQKLSCGEVVQSFKFNN